MRHPKISCNGAAPTGVAGEAEHLELTSAEERPPESVRSGLDTAMPDGIDIVEAVEARRSGIADRLQASLWLVELAGVGPDDDAAEAVAVCPAADSVQVERVAKKGRRRFDTRSAVVHIDVSGDTAESEPEGRHAAYAILHMVVRHTQPAARPNDVLTGLRHVADLAPPSSTTVTRLAQGPLDEATGAIADPLTVDRADAQATSTGTADPYAEERRDNALQPSASTAGPSR